MRRRSGSLLVVIALAALAWGLRRGSIGVEPAARSPWVAPGTPATGDAVANAFDAHLSNVQVDGVGVVLRLLPDDNDGSRHQRLILRLAGGQTVLVAHNVDLAPRLTGLDRGDTVAFRGEYEWNANGGVIHWTHRDPAGRHAAGWLSHDGRRVQ